MSGSKKDLSKLNLAAIGSGAEMGENNTEKAGGRTRRPQRERKVFRNFSLSMELADYEKFLDYLDDNGVDSGSKLLRNMMRDAGILTSPKE